MTSPSAGGLYTNTATVSSDAPDPVGGNDTAVEVTEVEEAGDPAAALAGVVSVDLVDVDRDGDLDTLAAGFDGDAIPMLR